MINKCMIKINLARTDKDDMPSRLRNKTELFSWYKVDWLFFITGYRVYERRRAADAYNEIELLLFEVVCVQKRGQTSYVQCWSCKERKDETIMPAARR